MCFIHDPYIIYDADCYLEIDCCWIHLNMYHSELYHAIIT